MTAMQVLRARRRASGGLDAGMSLAELLAYMVLSGIVLAIVGTLLVRTLVSQRDIRAEADASSSSQVVVTDIEGALRNAVSVLTPSTFDGRLLLVKTRVGDGDTDDSFACRAWLYDPDSGDLLTVTGDPGAAAPTRDLSTSSDFSSWTVALSGVRESTDDSGASLPVFASEGDTGAQIRLEVLDGDDGSSLTITTAAIPRSQGTSTGDDTCF